MLLESSAGGKRPVLPRDAGGRPSKNRILPETPKSIGTLRSRRVFMSNARIALTTAGSAEEARRIAQALVDRRLAACVNIVPQVESIFRWQEKVETASEFLLLIKTEAGVFDDLCDAV